MSRKMVAHKGNSAVAHVAHAVSEVIAIYPITPSSDMGEISDEKSAHGERNIWGTVPEVSELQSEGGAAGAVHGALCAGSLTTTFTASQGLLLMIPNMYKIAGELTPTAFHVSARAIACQGLSIFGDHSDVMAVRQTGFAMLASTSVQDAMDMALISHAATLEARVPFLHFFDGFRTSHEMQKIEELTFEDMHAMIDMDMVRAFRSRAMTPDKPYIKGTAQNPDVYFQGRETVNKYYDECPKIIKKYMDKFAKLTGRQYKLYDYIGAKDAEKVIVIMGSGAETVHETVEYLNSKGEKTGVLKVYLFRPFSGADMVKALPKSVKKIAVLDRTKEPGSIGEPLYQDVLTAISENMDGSLPKVIGGRYGLGSAEFTPAMVKAIFDELGKDKPKNRFVVGINDDVTKASLKYDPSFSIEADDVYRALFYGLGSDGTVGANQDSMAIISNYKKNGQGYFVYDSKKAGTQTVSHLRFGDKPIRRPYLITTANFLACHNFSFMEKYDMLKNLETGGSFLLTSEYDKDTVWDKLPGRVQKQIIDKKAKFYVIDAIKIAHELGLGAHINTIMQSAFFEISKVIDSNKAIEDIKAALRHRYGKKGEDIVNKNIASIDRGKSEFHEVKYPAKPTHPVEEYKAVPDHAPEFVKDVTAKIIKKVGDTIPVSKMPADGCWPVSTTQYEKRNIAVDIPIWYPENCVQCNRCSLLCPHGCIRPKAYDASALKGAPKEFKSAEAKGKELAGLKYSLQVAPEDCTGCGLCVESCPAKAKGAIKMEHQIPLREREAANWNFFLTLPETDPKKYDVTTIKGSQFVKPLFEFSGACLGCGETAYIKLLTQLVGDRLYVANATGCTSIYSGNLPTTPYTTRADGRGPTWNNSLFEDNAELAYGYRLSIDKFAVYARELAEKIMAMSCCKPDIKDLLGQILKADQSSTDKIDEQRERVAKVKKGLLDGCKKDDGNQEQCKELISVIDYLVKKSVWAIGGDGWAYDIGYGGLDHVIASGRNVKLLVLDTEVYSNTGGQASKSTPLGAVAKFAAGGKPVDKKDLALIAMSYGYVYVARVNIGADPQQFIKAIAEAEAYDGPALVLAYAHCIAHGINMTKGYDAQKSATESGHWPLYRYDPRRDNPLQLDSKDPTKKLEEYVYNENRYNILKRNKPEHSKKLVETAQVNVDKKIALLKHMAKSGS